MPTESDGYATAAATVISLGLALVAVAVTGASIAELRLARADLRRTQAEYGLGGAQLSAALTVIQSKQETRLAWPFTSDAGAASALAEPETGKVGFKAAADLDQGVFARLGVMDVEALRRRLTALAAAGGAGDQAIAQADAAPLWRACAPSLISPLGQADKSVLTKAEAPVAGQSATHGGEVWRLRVTAAGWTDDRLVRFTGNLDRPAAVIERRFYRDQGGQGCDALLASG